MTYLTGSSTPSSTRTRMRTQRFGIPQDSPGNLICLCDKIYTLDRLATQITKLKILIRNYVNKATLRPKPQYFSKKTLFAANFNFSRCIHFIFFFLPLWNSIIVDHFSYKIRTRFSLTNKLYSDINKVRSRLLSSAKQFNLFANRNCKELNYLFNFH